MICRYNTVPWYVIWQTGAIVDTATHLTRSSLVVSQTNSSLDNTAVTHELTSTPSPSPNSQTRCIHTPPQDDQKYHPIKLQHKVTPKYHPTRLSSPHLTSSIFTSLHRTNNNKHNDTVNLHAQNCCTHKLHNQTHPKNLQNVYKSKRNLVANDVQVSHPEFTIIITDQLMVGQ